MSPSSTTVGRVLRISSTKRIADRYGGAAEARNGLRWMCAGAPCTVVDAALRQKVQRRLPGKKRTTDRYKHRHCRFGRRTPSVRGPIKLMTVHNIISSLLHIFFWVFYFLSPCICRISTLVYIVPIDLFPCRPPLSSVGM